MVPRIMLNMSFLDSGITRSSATRSSFALYLDPLVSSLEEDLPEEELLEEELPEEELPEEELLEEPLLFFFSFLELVFDAASNSDSEGGIILKFNSISLLTDK